MNTWKRKPPRKPKVSSLKLLELKLLVQEAISRQGGETVNPFDCIKL